MFSTNRLIIRPEAIPDDLALLRPRMRHVGDGLTALWIGSRTAFIDARGGELVGMPLCSRLVDDGSRLWCNDGSVTVAYDYSLRAVTRTEAGIRLTFPDRDARFGDVTFPVFQRDDGSLARVDPTTGATQGDLVDTTLGNASGMTVNPNTATVDDMLLVADATMTARVDPATGEVVWRSEYGFPIKESLAAEGGILTGDGSQLYLLGSDTGEILDSWRPRLGFQMAGKADAVITVGLDDLARLDVP